MSLKLKGFSLSVIVATALSAFMVMEASAETGGHFVTDSPTGFAWLTSSANGTHTTELTVPGLTGMICEEARYEATIATTTEAVNATPKYGKCKTTGGTAGEVVVDTNGCQYQFTIGKKSTADNTVDLVCPEGKQVVVTHPNCEMKIPSQSGLRGAAYNTVVESGKHWLTAVITVSPITIHLESGFCVLLGTKKGGELTGSATVGAWEDSHGIENAANPVSVTATGSEG